MSDIEKLTEMVNIILPEFIENANTTIIGLSAQKVDLLDQISAIENEILTPMLSASDGYLVQKVLDLEVSECGGTCSICTSGDYGVSNLTEWAIVSGGCLDSHIVVWDSNNVSPSGSIADQEQYQRQVDFEEAYGHIHDSLGTTFGTYGLQGLIDGIDIGLDIQKKNKAKYEIVLDIYDDFI
jgi:hypothetical protein